MLSELAKLLASDESVHLDVASVLEMSLDNAGVYLEPAVKGSLLSILQRGVVKEDSVRKLSAERIGKLWMGRILSSTHITEFTMAPSLVLRLEKTGYEIANFTCVNIAVHGPVYNRILMRMVAI